MDIVDNKLTLMSINPTAIHDKEDTIADLGTSIIGLSETSATKEVQRISTERFKKRNVKSFWSEPVEPHSMGTSLLRGKQAGTAIRPSQHAELLRSFLKIS